jgi:hypothetical protein
MELKNKHLLELLDESHATLRETMISSDLPEWYSQDLLEYMLLSHLQEFYEVLEDKEKVSEAMADMTDVGDAEQSYDGQWYKV